MIDSFPPTRHAPILPAEDSQVTQNTSADATNARQLENPVGPLRTPRARPIADLKHVSVGKDSYYA